MATSARAWLSAQDSRLRVLLPVAAFSLAAVVLTVTGLYWVAARSDRGAIERQTREAEDAISDAVDDVARAQEIVTVWDQSVLELRKPVPDLDWVDENLAFVLHRMFDHNQFFILDGQEQAIYASEPEGRKAASDYAEIRPALQRLVDKVRGRLVVPPNKHERLPGKPPHPNVKVHTDPTSVHATEVVSLFGRPAAASVMPFMPMTPKVAPWDTPAPLAICIRFLDGGFLKEVGRRNMLEGLHFSVGADLAAGEHAVPFKADDGKLIGHLVWRPERPGTEVMTSMAPIVGGTVGVMLLLMLLLGRSLYRSISRQHAIMAELRANEAHAKHLAVHDVLTGLPNRSVFANHLDLATARGAPVTVLLLDLDRFKSVNDTLGHIAGDVLLSEFGARLLDRVRSNDVVARLGGDEFAILCPELLSPKAIGEFCEKIIAAVERPFHLSGTYVTVGVSIGVSTSDGSQTSRSELVRKADVALYRAKAEGRNCFRCFREEMDETVKLRSEIEAELHDALETGTGLAVHYQPQVDCRSGAIVGLEALVRWRHPVRGAMLPQQFIAIAEESGLIGRLGEWVLRQSCLASRRWPHLFVAVNFSPVQFRTPGFADKVVSIISETGADPRQIELEVTESVLLDDNDLVRDALICLRARGFRVALDDFGTGYSSLSYLSRFQVDKIKIDRSFVQPLFQDGSAIAIITAVLTLGHAMGLRITAEGVETADQHKFLADAGCDLAQGYLFSPAVPEEQIAAMLEPLQGVSAA